MTADSMFTHSRAADSPCSVEFLALVEEVVGHLHSARWGALGLLRVFHRHGPRLRLSGAAPVGWLLSSAGAELGSGDLRRRALSCCPGRDCCVHKLHSSVA